MKRKAEKAAAVKRAEEEAPARLVAKKAVVEAPESSPLLPAQADSASKPPVRKRVVVVRRKV
jgi:hypothetical protein